MALLTTRQKQQFFGPALFVLFAGGLISGVMQGNPVAIGISVALCVLLLTAYILWEIRRQRKAEGKAMRKRQAAAALAEMERDRVATQQRIAATQVELDRLRRLRGNPKA
ncbi:hypothetical protein [Arthrobacter sp. 92]|uniref:hypothetical protein n=1 Tax=Arthrobacter sp. 92 TaxID=3418175 RepID=UPI003D02BE13